MRTTMRNLLPSPKNIMNSTAFNGEGLEKSTIRSWIREPLVWELTGVWEWRGCVANASGGILPSVGSELYCLPYTGPAIRCEEHRQFLAGWSSCPAKHEKKGSPNSSG